MVCIYEGVTSHNFQSLSLSIDFVMEISEDPDEMSRPVAFYPGLHCLQKYPVKKGNIESELYRIYHIQRYVPVRGHYMRWKRSSYCFTVSFLRASIALWKRSLSSSVNIRYSFRCRGICASCESMAICSRRLK